MFIPLTSSYSKLFPRDCALTAVMSPLAANASSTNTGMITDNTRIAKRSTRKRSHFQKSCIYFSSFYSLIMPEIWLNYGKNEVVLDIMAENLDEQIKFEQPVIDDSVPLMKI